MTPPRCRWFRFSLRTLFVVVTLFACWLGYQLNWIRQRHAVLATQKATGWAGWTVDSPDRPSYLLRLFREKAAGYIVVGGTADPNECDRIRSLFPEATVVRSFSNDSAITIAPADSP